jgi:hypothetical protein
MNPNTSERSDAGISIVQEVFGFVKDLSGAKRRMDGHERRKRLGERTARSVPASARRDPERRALREANTANVADLCG